MKALIAVVLLLAAPLASAKLVSRDLISRDDGLLTLDTSTGLEWLDLTATRGVSEGEILAGEGEDVEVVEAWKYLLGPKASLS